MQKAQSKERINVAQEAFTLMCTAKTMTEVYEINSKKVNKYVHADFQGPRSHSDCHRATAKTMRLSFCVLS